MDIPQKNFFCYIYIHVYQDIYNLTFDYLSILREILDDLEISQGRGKGGGTNKKKDGHYVL